jgi:hypothetical protein
MYNPVKRSSLSTNPPALGPGGKGTNVNQIVASLTLYGQSDSDFRKISLRPDLALMFLLYYLS